MAKGRATAPRRPGRPANLERRSTAQTSHASESDTNDAAQALMSLAIVSPTSRHASGPSSQSTPTSPVAIRGPVSAPLVRAALSGVSDVAEPLRKRRRGISVTDVAFPSSSSARVNGSGSAMDVDEDVRMNGAQDEVQSVAIRTGQSRSRSYTLANDEIPMSGIGPTSINGVISATHASGAADSEMKSGHHGAGESRKSKPRNIDKVRYGNWEIKTWYHSPYPIEPSDEEDVTSAHGGKNGVSSSKGASANKRPRARGGKLTSNGQATPEEPLPVLWVCEWCFKYMKDGALLELHSKFCKRKHPPGQKVYARGAHFIYEVDGARDKLYCQNLALFGKFFIDIKTLFFDCENFLFYVLAEAESNRDHVLGFFSKEKVSYDDYNLATIVVFPPYQRKRYGMLMIEFSYELSRRAGKLGTPERPLSELGLRSYLMFWIQALVQFFRRLLSIQPGDLSTSYDLSNPVDPLLLNFVGKGIAEFEELKSRKQGFTVQEAHDLIWDRGLEKSYNSRDAIAATSGNNDSVYTQQRWMRASVNSDGSVTTHAFVKCTLEDMSKATGIRMEDIAFALHESGMLKHMEVQESQNVVVVSRKVVEDTAKRFNVKRMDA